MVNEYKTFKKNMIQSFDFNSSQQEAQYGEAFFFKLFLTFSKYWVNLALSGHEVQDSTIELVQVYFDTATFDNIEKDKKIKFDAQISLIGGTMGLLTGFSIISGVEIVAFLFKFIMALRFKKPAKDVLGK